MSNFKKIAVFAFILFGIFNHKMLFAANYVFSGKTEAYKKITVVKFVNEARIELEEKDDHIPKINFIEYKNTKGYSKIENDHVSIMAAYPTSSNAKVAIVMDSCGGSAEHCAFPSYNVIILENNQLNWYKFQPFEPNYSLNFKIENARDPELIVKNIKVLEGFDEFGDPILSNYKFAKNIGFINELCNPIYSKLIGKHPEDFFADKSLREPLIKILRKNQFLDLRTNMAVSSGSVLSQGKYIIFNGCKAHECPSYKGTLIIDAINGSIWTIWKNEEDSKVSFGATADWDKSVLELFHLSDIFMSGEKKEIESLIANLEKEIKIVMASKLLDKHLNSTSQRQGVISSKDEKKYNQNEIKKLTLQVSHSEISVDGTFIINIHTNVDTASLLIDGKEEGGKIDGNYKIKRVARAGQISSYTIAATDIYGNTESKTITVNRPIAESRPIFAILNPAKIKKQPERDAAAIIIGIADYKNLPRADFANDDARVFYDYAIRALGVKPENIRLLVDGDADEVGIYRAFKTWLPSKVQNSTDVYVYYSGHGLPTADGQGLYVLPQRADRDFIDKTAITQAEINAAIQAAKPRSVTVFLDACYSGQTRSGETLLASARPVALKVERQLFPDSFTVITASRADQISSSSPDLKHGIFSYYLMRGMEGQADANKDGKITAGEIHDYLAEQVTRQAGMMNRRQEPQLLGDADRVLVGR